MFKAIGQSFKDLPWTEIGTAFAAGMVVAAGVLAGKKIFKAAKASYQAAAEEIAQENAEQAS